MNRVIDAVRRFFMEAKLLNGRCENPQCQRILREDAPKIDGYRVCSQECADTVWWDNAA